MNRRKKIGFLSKELYNYFDQSKGNDFGGVTRIFRLVTALSRKKKFDITCFVGDYGQNNKVTVNPCLKLIKGPMGNRYRFLEVFWLLLKNRQDLMIEFFVSSRIFLLGLLKKITGQKFVYFVGHDKDVDGTYTDWMHPLLYRLHLWGRSQADQIICQTEYQVKMLKQNFNLDSIAVLAPYIEIKKSLDFQREFILWVGRSAFWKRPDIFLDIAQKMPDESFVMICNYSGSSDNHGSIHNRLQKRAENIPNLIFIESVPNESIQEYFSKAKFFVSTSDKEGFPNTFAEASIEKTPIVSLNVDPNQMFEAHHAGICCKGNLEKLHQTCRELSRNRERCQQLGENARKYIENFHDASIASEKISEIFTHLMSGR